MQRGSEITRDRGRRFEMDGNNQGKRDFGGYLQASARRTRLGCLLGGGGLTALATLAALATCSSSKREVRASGRVRPSPRLRHAHRSNERNAHAPLPPLPDCRRSTPRQHRQRSRHAENTTQSEVTGHRSDTAWRCGLHRRHHVPRGRATRNCITMECNDSGRSARTGRAPAQPRRKHAPC